MKTTDFVIIGVIFLVVIVIYGAFIKPMVEKSALEELEEAEEAFDVE